MNHVFTIGLLNLRFIHMSDYTQNSVRMCFSGKNVHSFHQTLSGPSGL